MTRRPKSKATGGAGAARRRAGDGRVEPSGTAEPGAGPQHSPRATALDAIARHVAHDLNNLLTAVVSFTSLAQESLPEDSPAARDLAQVLEAAGRARHLADALLPFSSAAPRSPGVTPVDERLRALDPVLQAMAGRRNRLEISIDSSGLGCSLDAGLVDQLLLGACLAVREAESRPGRLQLKASPGPEGPELTLVHALGEAERPREAPAEGPALASLEQHCRELGVSFEVLPGPPGDLAWRLRLPPSPLGEGTGTSAEVDAPPREPAAVILVVDDDPLILGPAGRVLRSRGHAVTLVGSAEEALELGEEALSRFDLLLSDIMLPGRDGDELARLLRERGHGAALAFMTGGRLDPEATKELEALGPVIAKPFTPEELQRHVAQALAARERGG